MDWGGPRGGAGDQSSSGLDSSWISFKDQGLLVAESIGTSNKTLFHKTDRQNRVNGSLCFYFFIVRNNNSRHFVWANIIFRFMANFNNRRDHGDLFPAICILSEKDV